MIALVHPAIPLMVMQKKVNVSVDSTRNQQMDQQQAISNLTDTDGVDSKICMMISHK